MLLNKVLEYLDDLIPPGLAEEWDACGLQMGDPAKQVRKILVCLDVDARIAQSASESDTDLVISHHPLFFDPVMSMDESTPKGRLIANLVRNRIAVYSAHTNLDQIPGGVSDALAERMGFAPVEPLVKADPFDGKTGFGRICEAEGKTSLFDLVRWAETRLGSPGILRNFSGDAPVSRIVFSGGSFPDEWIPSLVEKNADVLVTGEIGYHDMCDLASHGIHVLAVGHEYSERCIVRPLAERLAALFSACDVRIAFDGEDSLS